MYFSIGLSSCLLYYEMCWHTEPNVLFSPAKSNKTLTVTLVLAGGGVWSGHLSDTRLSLEAVWRAERRLRLHVDQQRALRPFLRHHDQQTPGRSQTAQPGLAVKWPSEVPSVTSPEAARRTSARGDEVAEAVPVEEPRSKFNKAHKLLYGWGDGRVGVTRGGRKCFMC